MCPICWIYGLIAFLVGIGLLAVDSPFTPFAIFLGVVLTIYALWKLREGYKKGKDFTKEQYKPNVLEFLNLLQTLSDDEFNKKNDYLLKMIESID